MNMLSRTMASVLALSVGVGLVLPARADSEYQRDFVDEMERLVELGASARTRHQARAQFQRLRNLAPSDYRVPYVYAVALVNQRRLKDAARVLEDVLCLHKGDLTAWQTSIWLSVLSGQHTDVLNKMEWLCKRMPSEAASGRVDMRCDDFAAFAGRIVGYLEGPATGHVGHVLQEEYRTRIGDQLPEVHRAVFEQGRQEVITRFDEFVREMDSLKAETQSAAAEAKAQQLARLDRDSDYAWSELERMEDLRAQVRQEATEERGRIAESQRDVLGTLAQQQSLAGQLAQPYYMTPEGTVQPPSVTDADVDAFITYSGLVPGFPPGTPLSTKLQFLKSQGLWESFTQWMNGQQPSTDQLLPYPHGQGFPPQGLNAQAAAMNAQRAMLNGQYWDAVARERGEQKRLGHRESRMNHRLRRVAGDEKRLLTRPNTGSSRQLMAIRAKATALATYVPMPLLDQRQQQRILTSFRVSASEALSQIASATQP